MTFNPNLTTLPRPQLQLWPELDATPEHFTLYGGTSLALHLGQAAPRDQAEGKTLYVASLLDLAGTKVAVVQKRAEAKDYLDIDVLIRHGIDLPTALAAGRIVY